MRTKRFVDIAVESILKNKMRSLLTMLGIIIGVGAVMMMVAVGQGAKSQIRASIDNLGTNLIVVTPGSSSQGGVSRGAGSFNRLTVQDAEAIKRESLLLSGVSPVIMAPTQAIGGQGNWRTVVLGVSTDYPMIRDWTVSSGRLFDSEDQSSMRKVAVIGATVAKNLFPDQDPVGQDLRLRDVPFQIIGVLQAKGQTANGNDQDDVVLAPFTTVQTRLAGHQFIGQILASTALSSDIPAAEDEVRSIMREQHKLAPYDGDDFTVRNQTDIMDAEASTTDVMTLLLAAIAGISLLVGGIGIMNIMLVSVTERTREIGIRMAIGARGSDVLSQFLVESIVLSVIGGALGVGLGFAGAKTIAGLTGWSTAIAPAMVALAIGFSAAVGIFFGFYPARKAAQLNPIEALRYE
ncbi:MAG: ABC transporter permease [Gemmatimonadetes bacterium]|nr:ABC transporter permease [Gemmatimonadota bacterium]